MRPDRCAQANLDTHQMLVFGHLIVTADILEDTPCVVFTADDQQHWQVHQHTNEYRPAGEFIIPGTANAHTLIYSEQGKSIVQSCMLGAASISVFGACLSYPA